MATNLLDAGSVSVPFESLKRVTRERKQVLGCSGVGRVA